MTAPAPRSQRPRRLRDRALRLAGLLTTPLLPADYLDLFDPLRTGADLRGRIVAVQPETRDAVTLVHPARPRLAPAHAGQYIRIGVDVDGVRQWRAYSLTSPAGRADGCIAITVKAIPDGKVSNHLVRRAHPGMLVHLDQAAGDFVLPDPRPAKVLFVTAGSGITPVMGMLRSAVDELDDVVVVHSAPTARRRHLRRRAARARRRRPHPPGRAAHRRRRAARRRRARGAGARPGRARDLGVRPDRHARRARGALGRAGIADRLHTERFRAHRSSPPARAARSRSPRPASSVEADGATRCSTPARTPAC